MINNSNWASVIDNEIYTHIQNPHYLKSIQDCLVAKAAFLNLMLKDAEFSEQIMNDPRTKRIITQVQ